MAAFAGWEPKDDLRGQARLSLRPRADRRPRPRPGAIRRGPIGGRRRGRACSRGGLVAAEGLYWRPHARLRALWCAVDQSSTPPCSWSTKPYSRGRRSTIDHPSNDVSTTRCTSPLVRRPVPPPPDEIEMIVFARRQDTIAPHARLDEISPSALPQRGRAARNDCPPRTPSAGLTVPSAAVEALRIGADRARTRVQRRRAPKRPAPRCRRTIRSPHTADSGAAASSTSVDTRIIEPPVAWSRRSVDPESQLRVQAPPECRGSSCRRNGRVGVTRGRAPRQPGRPAGGHSGGLKAIPRTVSEYSAERALDKIPARRSAIPDVRHRAARGMPGMPNAAVPASRHVHRATADGCVAGKTARRCC